MKKWFTVSMGEPLLPRFKLTTENKNYLLSWARVTHIEASKDFLSLQFACEIGLVQLSSDESMEALFDSMEAERIHCIRGEMLACRIMSVE